MNSWEGNFEVLALGRTLKASGQIYHAAPSGWSCRLTVQTLLNDSDRHGIFEKRVTVCLTRPGGPMLDGIVKSVSPDGDRTVIGVVGQGEPDF